MDYVLFAGCVLARADQENDGLSSKETVDMIQELAPDITRLAARRQIIRYVLPVNSAASVLKKSAQKVQATTSDRTNINVAQQYRWHCAVDEVYDLMRMKNTGLYEGVVKTARSTAIVAEQGSCRDRELDGDRVLRLPSNNRQCGTGPRCHA